MKNNLFVSLLVLVFFLFANLSYGQIVKGTGIVYTNGVPTHTPRTSTESEYAVDISAGKGDLYLWNRLSNTWKLIGEGIDVATTNAVPVAAPTYGESRFRINTVPTLYFWTGITWVPLSGSIYTAGTGIDITGNVISNTGDLSNTNEIQRVDTFRLNGTSLELSLINDGVPLSSVSLGSLATNIYTANGVVTDQNRTVSMPGSIFFANNTADSGERFSVNFDNGVSSLNTLKVQEGQGISLISSENGIFFEGATSFRDVLTPSALTGNTNNYTGLNGANVGILSSNGAYNITGIDGGFNGRILFLFNNGNFDLTFVDQSGLSSVENRFYIGSDFVLKADTGSAIIMYDTLIPAWRIFKTGSSGGISSNIYTDDGTTSDNTRTLTVTETLNITGTNDFGDPIPFQVNVTGNEPQAQLWDFGTDSLVVGQSDTEIYFKSNTNLLLNSDNTLIFQADSVLYTNAAIEEVTTLESILGLQGTSGNPTTKQVKGSQTGHVLVWDEPNQIWELDVVSVGGGDDWGAQYVRTDSSLQGRGLVSNLLTITGYDDASNGQVPSKQTDTLVWITPLLSEVDGSITNEIQQLDTFQIVSNILRASLSLDGVPFKSVDLSPYLDNTDSQNLTIEGSGPTYDIAISGGSDVTIQGGGIVTLSESPANTLIITATEVDGSVTNEGVLSVGAGTGTTSLIQSNSSGSATITLTGAGITTVNESGNTITITSTEVDGSTTNEIQQIDTFDIVSDIHRASLSSDGVPFKSVDLSPYRQRLDTFEIVSNILRASLSNDNLPFSSVNLAPYLDNTDDQTLSIDSAIVGSVERYAISIENGNTVYFDIPLNDTTTTANIYTTNGTTTDLLRIVRPLRSLWFYGTDTLGFIRQQIGLLKGGRLEVTDDSTSIYFDGSTYGSRLTVMNERILLQTEGDAGTVDILTDTVKLKVSSAPGINQVVLLESDATVFKAGSSQIVAIGDFPNFPFTSSDSDVGFLYDPASNGSLVVGGDGSTVSTLVVSPTEAKMLYDDGTDLQTMVANAGGLELQAEGGTDISVTTNDINFTHYSGGTLGMNLNNSTKMNFDSLYEFSLGRWQQFPSNASTYGGQYGVHINGDGGFGSQGKRVEIKGSYYDRNNQGSLRVGGLSIQSSVSTRTGVGGAEQSYSGGNSTTGFSDNLLHSAGFFTDLEMGGKKVTATSGSPRSFRDFNYMYHGKGKVSNDTFPISVFLGWPQYTDTTGVTERSYSTFRGFAVQAHVQIGALTGSRAFNFLEIRTGLTNADTTANSVGFYKSKTGGGGYYLPNAVPGVDCDTCIWVTTGTSSSDAHTFLMDKSAFGGGGSGGNGIYGGDGALPTGGTDVDLSEGSLRLNIPNDAAIRYGLVVTGDTDNSANRFIQFKTEADSMWIQESGSGYTMQTFGRDLNITSSEQLSFLADSIEIVEGSAETQATVRFLLGLTPNNWIKRVSGNGNNGDIMISNGTDWTTGNINDYVFNGEVHVYTTAQTHTALSVPAGATVVEAFVLAGGGGGGSGRRGAAGEVRAGGGGGAGGWSSFTTTSLSALGSPSTIYITVGAGGTGGAARSSDNQNGADGTNGGNSYVSTTASSTTSFVQAVGGGLGGGGSTGAGAAGSVGTGGGMLSSGAGAASSASGAVGNASGTNAYVSGGGSGGGITTGNSASAGGAAGVSYAQQYALLSGGAINTNGSSATPVAGRQYGQGGSGGGSSTTTTAGSGGAGIAGGGGGGGGSSVNGNNSGAGGNGGAGYVIITFR